MIRRPTPAAQLYAWHRAALKDPDLPRHDSIPECGWYKTKLVRGGPWVPVEISVKRVVDLVTGELTEPEAMTCTVDGTEQDPARIWTYLTPISRAEFDQLCQRIFEIPAMLDARQRIDLTAKAIRP